MLNEVKTCLGIKGKDLRETGIIEWIYHVRPAHSPLEVISHDSEK